MILRTITKRYKTYLMRLRIYFTHVKDKDGKNPSKTRAYHSLANLHWQIFKYFHCWITFYSFILNFYIPSTKTGKQKYYNASDNTEAIISPLLLSFLTSLIGLLPVTCIKKIMATNPILVD